MADTSLTHKDLAEALGVSVTTVKSYRRKFPGFVPVAGYGKPIRFQPRALEVCTKIRECFTQGLSVTETEKRLRQAGFKPEGVRREPSPTAAAAATMAGPGVSQEYLEQFFKTAGQMMQGMAQLATAQARSESRLSRLEDALKGLMEAEAGSQALLGELAAGFRSERGGLAPEGQNAQTGTQTDREAENAASAPIEDEPAPSAKAEEPQERRIRAKKIVNVRGRDRVDSYALENHAGNDDQESDAHISGGQESGTQDAEKSVHPEQEERETSKERPTDAFLSMPVAIRSERGDFLGLPGRLSLSDFVDFLVRLEGEAGPVLSHWKGADDTWALSLRTADRRRRELGFSKHTTGRGVHLAVLLHLNRDGVVADRDELTEFFREMKDLIHFNG